MLSPDSEKTPSSPNNLRADLGRRGEDLAAAYLEQQGYRLVAANVTLPVGRNLRGATITAEIDLVAYDGPTLCFVEVKTRASDWFAAPEVNVNRRKQRQVARAARAYRHMLGLEGAACRFDVVSIVLPADDDPVAKLQIEIMRGFWTEERLKKHRVLERFWD